MKIDWSFPRQVLIALFVMGVCGIYPILRFASVEVAKAVLLGAILTTMNVLMGYAAIEYSIGKSTTTFFKYVLGGMGIRLLFLAVALVLLIRLFSVHSLALVGSMGVFYIVFLTLEIIFIQKKVTAKNQ